MMTDAKKPRARSRRWSDTTNINRAQARAQALKEALVLEEKKVADLLLKQAARERWRILGDACRRRMEQGEDPPEVLALANAMLVRDEDRRRFKLAPRPSEAKGGAPSGVAANEDLMEAGTEPVGESGIDAFADDDVDSSLELANCADEDSLSEEDGVDECPPTGTDPT